jgi:hypothetical protein
MSSCPIAHGLVDEFTKATDDYEQASKKLGDLAGLPEEFAETKKHCNTLCVKCLAAYNSLELHRKEHGSHVSAIQRAKAVQAMTIYRVKVKRSWPRRPYTAVC